MLIHPIPSLPWSKVATDLFELDGFHYLIMVDYYSNFIEVASLKRDTTSQNVIKHLKENIARYGIIDMLISDNGPQYTGAEFKSFVASYGIEHITSSPLYSQSNGLAEKAVQTVKNLFKKCSESGDDVYLSLLDLRNTPRDEQIGSPMQRLMGRRAKTQLPMSDNLRKPTTIQSEVVSSKLMDYHQKQKHYYDRGAKEREQCQPGDTVRIQSPEGWKPAEFVEHTDKPRSHIVKAGSGRVYRRNNRMLLKTKEEQHVISSGEYVMPPIVNSRNTPVLARREP
ncbi:uncharacterized protein K02A2.6-like [Ostrea edulis]|uniref:uncharacterized protein K02A2.6-like n=1 Tax=Ostrea edulis TaxID=37623 RepID=UPI0024AF971B|nr:uncharacterized protein K02A2.6-like [Ostrea edulis]